MERLDKEVLKDIEECERILESYDVVKAKDKIREIVATYGNYIQSITSQLRTYIVDNQDDRIKDIKILKRKLELFLATDCTPTRYYKKSRESYINIENTNTNINEINIEIDFQQVREDIENMTSLPTKEIDEILSKIDEIQQIYNSDEKNNRKWNKLSNCMEWLSTKGVDVAIKLLPIIMNTIQK